MKQFLLIPFILCWYYSIAQCTIVNPLSSPWTTNNLSGYDYVQSFTATCTGDMENFYLTAAQTGTFPGGTLSVYNGNVSSGTPIYVQSFPDINISNIGDPISFDITGTLPLVAGNQYSFSFYAIGFNFYFSLSNPYPGGNVWQNDVSLPNTDYDFGVSILASSCTATSILTDLTQLSDITSDCSLTIGTPPTATNDCGVVIYGVPNVSFPITAPDTTQVIWTYDDGQGNSTSQSQNIIISDQSAPIPDVAQLPIIYESCQVLSLSPPTATDSCEGAISGVSSVVLPITAAGTTQITWLFSDSSGNTSFQTQDVVIADVTAPVPDITQLPTINEGCELTSLVPPTATDNCAGSITGTTTTVFPITTQGVTQVNWTYDDGMGNVSTQSQDVVIADVTAPVPDITQLPTITEGCELASLVPPTATDNCAGGIIGATTAIFPITSQGVTQVIWTFDDGMGNVSTQSQDVVISDTIAPVPDVPQLADLTNQCMVTTLIAPTATDNCAGTITATTTTSAPIQTLGNSEVLWTFDDGNGNVSTQIQNVINPTIDNTVTVTGGTIQSNQSGAVYQWLDCDAAFAAISGEIFELFTTSVTGNYAVEINVQGCLDTSACELIDFTGIEELTLQGKKLVKIIDLTGREIEFRENTPLIFIYSDGTIRRVMEVKY